MGAWNAVGSSAGGAHNVMETPAGDGAGMGMTAGCARLARSRIFRYLSYMATFMQDQKPEDGYLLDR